MEELYQKMYYSLFNAVTDALRELDAEKIDAARWILMRAQQKTEALFIEAED